MVAMKGATENASGIISDLSRRITELDRHRLPAKLWKSLVALGPQAIVQITQGPHVRLSLLTILKVLLTRKFLPHGNSNRLDKKMAKLHRSLDRLTLSSLNLLSCDLQRSPN